MAQIYSLKVTIILMFRFVLTFALLFHKLLHNNELEEFYEQQAINQWRLFLIFNGVNINQIMFNRFTNHQLAYGNLPPMSDITENSLANVSTDPLTNQRKLK